MKQQPLWFWGFLCILGAGFASVITGMKPAATREEALGRGLGSLLMVIVGVVLIIAHFFRRKN